MFSEINDTNVMLLMPAEFFWTLSFTVQFKYHSLTQPPILPSLTIASPSQKPEDSCGAWLDKLASAFLLAEGAMRSSLLLPVNFPHLHSYCAGSYFHGYLTLVSQLGCSWS